MHLYKANILRLDKAKKYPKIFFTLAKLGAVPNNAKKTSKSYMGFYSTLTMTIVKSKSIDKASRIHILQFMLKKNWILLDPCGPLNMSPLEYCLIHRQDCLPILLKTPEIEKST